MANEAKQFTIGGVTHDVMDVGARHAIASLQNAIDAITSGDTTTAIKTFQEVIDFLDGVTDDATLIGKMNELRTLIAAKYSKPASGIPASDLADGVIPDLSGFATKTEVNAKANSDDVYSKTDVDTKVADAGKVKTVSVNGGPHSQPDAQGNVDVSVPSMTLDDVPTAGSNNAVKSGGVKQAIDEKLTQVTVNALPSGTAVLDAAEVDNTLYIYLAQAEAKMTIVPSSLKMTGDAPGKILIIGNALTQNISIVASSGFSVDVNTLTPTDANDRANIITVSYTGSSASANGTVMITSGDNMQVVSIDYILAELPAGFRECEYIQGGNKKYIMSGINATSEIRIVTKLQNNNSSDNYTGLFGIRNGDSSIRLEAFESPTGVQNVRFTGCDFGSVYLSTDASNPHTIDVSKYRLIYDGSTYLNANDGESVSWQSTLQIEIGGLNINGTPRSPNSDSVALKIYSFDIYEGGTLVRSYIPAYNTNTSKYGLYDLVGGTFSPSADSSDFTGQIKS